MSQVTAPNNPSAAEPSQLRIYLLGRFQVSVGGQPIADRQWRLRKSRSLIKLLALAPQHRLHRDQLLDALWPDLPPAEAAHNLHQVLYIARRALDPTGGKSPHLQMQDEILSLGPDSALWIDAEAFEAAAQQARQTHDANAYSAALDLYTSDLLPDDRYEDWAGLRRDALHRLFLALLIELTHLHEHALDHAGGIETANRVLATDPAHEEAHRSLMRLYARSGHRQQALRQFQLLKESLQREVEAEPDAESERLYNQILAGRFAPQTVETSPEPPPAPQPSTAPPQPVLRLLPSTRHPHPPPAESQSVRNNLPIALNSFIGRESAMADIKRLLANSRLITLTGSGGCGKTRLAIQVASDFCRDVPVGDVPVERLYRDGVWLVEFAALSDPALVVQEVASALDVREQPGQPLLNTLIDHLRNKQMLMVFDNCEHLIAACAQLAESLLRACAHLRILATSREALHIAGEANYRVPSLSVPAVSDQPSAVSVQDLQHYEAVRLFSDRAEAANSAFRLTSGNAPALARICTQLEGMPLAIELAAARVTSLSAEQIAARLEDRFRLLTGGSRTAMPRQQTLQAAIDWSYDLLTEPERVLLRRLSVFAGGWTLEAAEAVCSDDGRPTMDDVQTKAVAGLASADVLDLLTRLVDKSLVLMNEDAGEIRYRMLETIRQYARENLSESGEDAQIRERHAALFSRLALQAEPKLFGAKQAEWFERLEREHANLRAAIQWSLDGGTLATSLSMAAALLAFWEYRVHQTEGRTWIGELLAHSHVGERTAERAKALSAGGYLALRQRDYVAATPMLNEALVISNQIDDQWNAAWTLARLGLLAAEQGDHTIALSSHEQSLALWRQLGNKHGISWLLMYLGGDSLSRADYVQAQEHFEESAVLLRELGDNNQLAFVLRRLAELALNQSNSQKSVALCKESLVLNQRLRDRRGCIACLVGLAAVMAVEGKPVYAVRWLVAGEALLNTMGTILAHADRTVYDHHLNSLRLQMDEATFAKIWSEGCALTSVQLDHTAADTKIVLQYNVA